MKRNLDTDYDVRIFKEVETVDTQFGRDLTEVVQYKC